MVDTINDILAQVRTGGVTSFTPSGGNIQVTNVLPVTPGISASNFDSRFNAATPFNPIQQQFEDFRNLEASAFVPQITNADEFVGANGTATNAGEFVNSLPSSPPASPPPSPPASPSDSSDSSSDSSDSSSSDEEKDIEVVISRKYIKQFEDIESDSALVFSKAVGNRDKELESEIDEKREAINVEDINNKILRGHKFDREEIEGIQASINAYKKVVQEAYDKYKDETSLIEDAGKTILEDDNDNDDGDELTEDSGSVDDVLNIIEDAIEKAEEQNQEQSSNSTDNNSSSSSSSSSSPSSSSSSSSSPSSSSSSSSSPSSSSSSSSSPSSSSPSSSSPSSSSSQQQQTPQQQAASALQNLLGGGGSQQTPQQQQAQAAQDAFDAQLQAAQDIAEAERLADEAVREAEERIEEAEREAEERIEEAERLAEEEAERIAEEAAATAVEAEESAEEEGVVSTEEEEEVSAEEEGAVEETVSVEEGAVAEGASVEEQALDIFNSYLALYIELNRSDIFETIDAEVSQFLSSEGIPAGLTEEQTYNSLFAGAILSDESELYQSILDSIADFNNVEFINSYVRLGLNTDYEETYDLLSPGALAAADDFVVESDLTGAGAFQVAYDRLLAESLADTNFEIYADLVEEFLGFRPDEFITEDNIDNIGSDSTADDDVETTEVSSEETDETSSVSVTDSDLVNSPSINTIREELNLSEGESVALLDVFEVTGFESDQIVSIVQEISQGGARIFYDGVEFAEPRFEIEVENLAFVEIRGGTDERIDFINIGIQDDSGALGFSGGVTVTAGNANTVEAVEVPAAPSVQVEAETEIEDQAQPLFSSSQDVAAFEELPTEPVAQFQENIEVFNGYVVGQVETLLPELHDKLSQLVQEAHGDVGQAEFNSAFTGLTEQFYGHVYDQIVEGYDGELPSENVMATMENDIQDMLDDGSDNLDDLVGEAEESTQVIRDVSQEDLGQQVEIQVVTNDDDLAGIIGQDII